MNRWCRSLIGVVCAALLLSGCGDRPGLDTAAVQTYLAKSQSAVFGATAKVGQARCPGRHDLQEPTLVRCTLDVSGTKVPYRVRLTHVHSRHVAITATLDGVVLDVVKVRDYVRSTLPKDFRTADLDCGHRFLVTKVGRQVSCTLTSGAQTKELTLTVKDAQGTVDVS